MQENPTLKRAVPTELLPRVIRMYGDLLLRNEGKSTEIHLWNIAADMVWWIELTETQLFLKQLINTSK